MEDTEVAGWLKALPLAPEYHPTEVEFSDPVAYVLKIEAEARQYGICKIVPPFCKASKESAIHNLNSSLVSNGRSNGATKASDIDSMAKFTTRRQQLGKSRRHKGVLAEQCGESYTIDQFEVKAYAFSKAHLGTCKDVSPLSLESLFWKAVEDKPVTVEYADHIQGSAFAEHSAVQNRKRKRQNNDEEKRLMEMNEQIICKNDYPGEMEVLLDDAGKYHRHACLTLTEDYHLHVEECDTDCIPGWKLANSSWNMRYVARSPGSLLQFIPHEIPGVTSPMVYIGMLFSCFAWQVEDHDLHSLDYLHLGAPKTWYAVPPDAALALQEVARMFGGNIDPQAAFALLGEKTTIMSPEVLVGTGVPCCRLVQNAGEYVVTFPSAYHLGFSHGFNCGETATFATPKWLDVIKEAATRRVALKRLPMLSHQLLLYRLATSLPPQFPSSTCPELQSSSLNEKLRHQDEEIIKIKFVNDALSNNHSLKNLSKLGIHICLMLEGTVINDDRSLPTFSMQHSKALSSQKSSNATIASIDSIHLDAEPTPNQNVTSRKETLDSNKCENLGCGQENIACCCIPANLLQRSDPDSRKTAESYLDWGTLSCAACGVLCFTTICIVQPIMETTFEKNLADQQREPTGSNGAYDHKVGLSFCQPTGDINIATQSDSLCMQIDELEQTQVTMELAPSCCSIALDVKDGVAEITDTMEKQNTENKKASISIPFNETCYDTKTKSYAELGPERTCSERIKPLLESVNEVKVEINKKDKGSSKCKLEFPNYNINSEASNILHEHEHELGKSIASEALSASQAPNSGPTEGESNTFLLERSMSTSMLTSLELLVATYNDDSDVDNQTCNDSVGPNEIMERGLKDQVSTSLDALWSQPCLLGIGEDRNLASEYNKFSCGSVAGFMTFIQENTCTSELSDVCESYVGAAQSAGENNANNILANSRKFEEQQFNNRCDNEDTFNRGEFMQTNDDAAGGNAVGGTLCPAKNDMGSISGSTKLENLIKCPKLGAPGLLPRILCLAHALEVQEKSRLNGVHLLVVCHADFLQFEARAKAMAKEMNLNKNWEEIPFRKPDRDELQIIATAIDSRIGHIHANNDWVLDVSLKDGNNHQDSEDRHIVPGNTDANTASPNIDTTQVEHFKEENCWVVGKWCGNIWRADQVHSLLGGCKDVPDTWGRLMTDAGSPVIDKPAPEESPVPNDVQTYHCTNEQGSPKGSIHQNIASSGASLPQNEDLDIEHKDAHKHMPVHAYKDFDDGGEAHAVALTQSIRGRKRKGFGRKRKLLPKSKRRSPEEKPECWSVASEKAGICNTDLMTENQYTDNAGSLDCTCSMELCNHCRTAAVMLRLKLDSPHQESFGMVSVCADQESSLSTGKSEERFPCISDTSEKLHELPEVEIGHDLIQGRLLSATAVLSAKDKQGIRKSLLQLSGLDQAQNEDCGSLPVTGYINSEADMQSVWHDVPILCSASLYSEFSYIGQYIERMSESVYPFADISESFIPYHKNKLSCAKIQQGSDGVCAVGHNRHNASGGTSNNYGTQRQQPDAQNKQGLIMGIKRKRQNPTLDDMSFKKVALPAEDRLQYSQGQGSAMPHVNQKIEETLGSDCKLETTKTSPDVRNIACKSESHMEVHEAFAPHKQSGCLSMPSIPSVEEHGGDSEPFSVDSLGSVLPIISSPEKKSATRSKRMRSPGWTGLLQQKSECDIQKLETTELTENSEGGASEKKHEKWIKLSDCGKGSTIGPVTRLRAKFPPTESASEKPTKAACNRTKRRSHKLANPIDGDEGEESYTCSIDGCYMKFVAQTDLLLHKRNICTYQSCGKQLCSHSYLLQHFRVHVDDRPLKCPWKGCTKTFKWAWARTEHIRVHTGERPYVCKECGKRYRFVSDFSRHKRNTGHAS